MKRLKEPSTWAGFGVLFQILGSIRPEWAIYAHILSGAAASLAVAVSEKAAR